MKKLIAIGATVVMVLSLVVGLGPAANVGAAHTSYTLLETLSVPAKDVPTVTSTVTLLSGRNYRFEASGTYHAGGSYQADAEYCTTDGWVNHSDDVPGYTGYGEGLLELMVDGNIVEWGKYKSSHVYTLGYAGTGGTVQFQIYDIGTPPGGNNSGSLTVKISVANKVIYVPTDHGTIQAAVDAALPGDTIIVHTGVYPESVVFGPEDSGITLKGKAGAILDGTGLATVDGIRLLAGVSDVTIEGFEIRDYTGTGAGQGNAIQAWNSGTSDITIENNDMHDNSWNAILVGNEGQGLHTGWKVKNNVISNSGFYSLELTNAQDSEIRGNIVTGGTVGILVQARNTIPDSGMVTVSDVRVMSNTVSDAAWTGVYILAMASGPLDPFPPIVGAQSTLEDVMCQRNNIDQSGAGWGAWVYGYLGGQVINARIIRNTFTSNGGPGVGIFGHVTNAKIVNNKFKDCNPEISDGGQATKIPKGPK